MISTLAGIWNNINVFPKSSDVYLSSLPFSHIYERVIIFALTYAGASIGFMSESPDKIFSDMKDLRPTIISGVPQIYHILFEQI